MIYYYLRRTTDGAFLARSKSSYVRKLRLALRFDTREDAERERSPENEIFFMATSNDDGA